MEPAPYVRNYRESYSLFNMDTSCSAWLAEWRIEFTSISSCFEQLDPRRMIVFDFGRIFASKFSGKFKYQMTDISVGWLKMSTETQAMSFKNHNGAIA